LEQSKKISVGLQRTRRNSRNPSNLLDAEETRLSNGNPSRGVPVGAQGTRPRQVGLRLVRRPRGQGGRHGVPVMMVRALGRRTKYLPSLDIEEALEPARTFSMPPARGKSYLPMETPSSTRRYAQQGREHQPYSQTTTRPPNDATRSRNIGGQAPVGFPKADWATWCNTVF